MKEEQDPSGTVASEISRKRAPRGQPFPAGNDAGRRWTKGGPSPNPGGRPRTGAESRARCREIASELLERLAEDPDPAVARVFEVVADRGGYCKNDNIAATEAHFGEAAVRAMFPASDETGR